MKTNVRTTLTTTLTKGLIMIFLLFASYKSHGQGETVLAPLLKTIDASIISFNNSLGKVNDKIKDYTEATSDISKLGKHAMQAYNTAKVLIEFSQAVTNLICILEDFELMIEQNSHLINSCKFDFEYQMISLNLTHIDAVLKGLAGLEGILSPGEQEALYTSAKKAIIDAEEEIEKVEGKLKSARIAYNRSHAESLMYQSMTINVFNSRKRD